jgi:glucose-6-phosphate 1-epimerase
MSDPTRDLADPALRPGAGGLPMLALEAPDGARAELYVHGAHVTSWRPAGGDERLYLSAASEFRDGVAIRGGVPVIFPQFAGRGPLPKHGFARTARWTLAGVARDAREARATLHLADSAATRAVWPHAFRAELTVAVGGPSLRIALAVANAGDAPLDFTAALHTYLRVADAARAALVGLAGARYEDSAADGALRVDRDATLRMDGEVDRVYLDAPGELELRDDGRTTVVAATGFPDTVVWNPGPVRAAALADLEPEGWRRMLCVEAAVVGRPVRLGAGERWEGAQTLTAR